MMGEACTRFVLKLILSVAVIVSVVNAAMWAWPDASAFTGPQALVVLLSMLLWSGVGVCGVCAAVGKARERDNG